MPRETICPGIQCALVYNVPWYTMCPRGQCSPKNLTYKKFALEAMLLFGLFGPCWPLLASPGPTLPLLALLGPVWPRLAPYISVSPRFILFGPVWSCAALFDPFGSILLRLNKILAQAMALQSVAVQALSTLLVDHYFHDSFPLFFSYLPSQSCLIEQLLGSRH